MRAPKVRIVKWITRWLKDYRRNAARRAVPWDLSDAEFLELVQKDCHYCGTGPRRITPMVDGVRRISREKLNGIDRLDPSKGYEPANCVPCCRNCNWAKLSFNEIDFIAHIEKILSHWRPKK